jgi:hypothetical protein
MRIRKKSEDPVWKKARRGFRGYPIATVGFYGPTDQRASKVVVGVMAAPDAEVDPLERWFSDEDVRFDPSIRREIHQFIETNAVKTVKMSKTIIGCPHEEGVDYAEGTSCPKCPFWDGRDRFAAERAAQLAHMLADKLYGGPSHRTPDGDVDEFDEDPA